MDVGTVVNGGGAPELLALPGGERSKDTDVGVGKIPAGIGVGVVADPATFPTS